MIKIVNLRICAVTSLRIGHRVVALYRRRIVPCMIDLKLVDNTVAIIQIGIAAVEDPVDPPLNSPIASGEAGRGDRMNLHGVPRIRIEWSRGDIRSAFEA